MAPCPALAPQTAASAAATAAAWLSLALAVQGCAKNGPPPAGGPAALGRCSPMGSHGRTMHCGEGVPLCAVLTLETGRGGAYYRHSEPVVHGLWPQVGEYGDSQCVRPRDAAPPRSVFSCYDQAGQPHDRNLGFERHEWQAHGKCAGAADAQDFFDQVCALAEGPLRVMRQARAAELDIVDTADALHRAGYCVWRPGSHAQLELSACAGRDGRWRLADASAFRTVCGGAPTAAAVCAHGRHGPPCQHDSDCAGARGCARCARSGFCTDVPLPPALLRALAEGRGAAAARALRTPWLSAEAEGTTVEAGVSNTML